MAVTTTRIFVRCAAVIIERSEKYPEMTILVSTYIVCFIYILKDDKVKKKSKNRA